MTTSSADKKYLRQLGHQLNPVVIVAAKGLNENVLLEIDRALRDHELIKIKLAVAQLIQSIGHIVLVYRKADKPNPKLSNLLRQ